MKISVLISLYDKEQPDYLHACFESLAIQTLPAAEIIVVYDGAINKALQQVVSHWQAQLPIRIVTLAQNIGLGPALNAGLSQCQYAWVARMDTDDICVPTRFEQQVAFIKNHPTISVCGGQILEFDTSPADAKQSRQVPTTPEAIRQYAKARNPINHMTVLYQKSAVLAIGGYQPAPLYEDYDLWIRLLQKNYQFANLAEVIVYARAGAAMFERRGGLDYAKNEMALQLRFYQQGFLSLVQLLKNLAIRLPVRLMPIGIRQWVYQRLLRR